MQHDVDAYLQAGVRIAHRTVPTQERLKELFDYQPETGLLYSKIKRGKLHPGQEVGYVDGYGYIYCGVGSRKYIRAHRIIWVIVHGPIPRELCIDHIDGNRLNNRIENLRVVDRITNQRNMRMPKNNTSGRVGVYRPNPKSDKWFASISVKDSSKHLGMFDKFEDAVAAREQAERDLGFHENHGKRAVQ